MYKLSIAAIITDVKKFLLSKKKEGLVDSLSEQLNYLKKSRFIRDVTIVAGGSAAAQAISIAFSPFITRLYGPESFGILGVFVAMLAMITPIASLAYTYAIVLPANDHEARALVRLALLIAACIAILLAVIIGVFHYQIALFFGFEASAYYLLLIPALVLLSAAEKSLGEWLIRKKQFRSISGITVTQTAAINTTKVGVGYFLATAPVLLVINAVGHGFLTFMLWLSARTTFLHRNFQEMVSEAEQNVSIKTVAVKYRDFPIYRSPQIILNTTSINIPTLLLAALMGPVPAGFYTLSRRVVSLPSSLVAKSVGTVFLPRIAEAAKRGEPLRPYIIKATWGLALVGLLPFGVLFLFGPWLFGFVFGADWITAGEYSRWLALWLYFAFINHPSVYAIPLFDMQRQFLIYEIISIVVRCGALIIGALFLASDLVGIALFSITGAVINMFLIIWVISRSEDSVRKL